MLDELSLARGQGSGDPGIMRKEGGFAFLTVVVLGCGSTPQTPQPVLIAPLPIRTAATRADVATLLADELAEKACDRLVGHFVPIADKASMGAAGGLDASEGRWWIRGCQVSPAAAFGFVRPGWLSIHLEGVGWSWFPGKEESGYEVRPQYVYFGAKGDVLGQIDAAYDRSDRVVSVWFSPSPYGPPAVQGQGLRPIEAHAELGGAILDVLTLGIAAGKADQTANDELAAEVRSHFRQRLGAGLTATFDLRTNQFDFLMQALPAGQTPSRPSWDDARAWLANERMILRQGAPQVMGPFPATSDAEIDVRLESGPSLVYRTLCKQDVDTMFAPVASGLPPKLLGGSVLLQASTATRIAMPLCSWYFVLETGPVFMPTTAAVRVLSPTQGGK